MIDSIYNLFNFDYSNLTFLRPYFLGLIFLPLIWFIFFQNIFKIQKNSNLFIPFKHLEDFQKQSNSNNPNFKTIYIYLIWLILVIAISGPISVLTNKHTEKNGYRISLVIDTSLSMNALDFSKNKNDLTTRLDVIKNVIAKFIKNKNNDFFSLITFGDFPVLQSPLTADKNAIIQYLNNSYVGEFGNSTAMGDALGLAINSLNEFNKSRVIILLTDGANSSGEFLPETIAYIAKEKNIPIYTIGIGKEDKVPLLISNNRITYEFLPLDEKSLKQIAEISNGKYFKVTDINDLKKVYSEISKLTKVKLKSYDNVEIKYHHKELLILAFMMLIIAHFFKLIFVFRI